MDNTEEFRSLELCAGYGGIHLGLKRVIKNLRTVVYVEIECFADANLVAKMEAGHLDAAPIWTDLKTFNAKPFRDRIHLVTGGYPCQPFSAAGKRLGTDDPRHLWPHILKIVKTIRPVFCFFENVEGHLSLGFQEVQQSLRTLGYRVEAGIFSAAEVGAPQQRKRLFILAHCCEYGSKAGIPRQNQRKKRGTGKSLNESHNLGNTKSDKQRRVSEPISYRERITDRRSSSSIWPSRPGQPQYEWEPPRVVANSFSLREPQQEGSEQNKRGWPVNEGEEPTGELGDTANNNGRRGECQTETGIRPDGIRRRRSSESSQRQTKPTMGGNSNGADYRLDNAELYQSSDNRTDELRLLGNGVMPDVAEKAFVTLLNKIMESNDGYL